MYAFRKSIRIGANVATNGSILEGKNQIHTNTVFVGSYLGKGSYIGTDGYFSGAQIGKFCSIGNRVKIVNAIHPSSLFVSTHPAFFSLSIQAGFTYAKEQCFQEQKFLDEEDKIAVSIGNDVWIGDEVMIMGGIKIHDGAIIGTRAIVTKDVQAYAIVGGIPAKLIRKRFNEEEIEFLLRFRWWDKEEHWINKNIKLFRDIKHFMKESINKS